MPSTGNHMEREKDIENIYFENSSARNDAENIDSVAVRMNSKDSVFRRLFSDKAKTRQFTKEQGSIQAGVKASIEWCLENDVLREFLIKERGEIYMLTIYEYNAEEERRKLLAEVELDKEKIFSDGFQKGRSEGKAEGEKLLAELIAKLASLGKNDDISKAALDAGFREKLYLEYGIKKA